ncbi:GrpB family protein [Deinococcus planocerae]|uniref:GrpB family protein n=1 Tax=Deinococcus planocerae TaxID=1737569 RepID=UPI0015E071A6|nr:GrpB family protein [Deinococcus planocerae]
MSGPAREVVRVERYDSRWPQWASREITLLRGSLGDRIAEIEHIGSTAVPGLDAKPTVDLMLGTVGWPWRPEDDACLLSAGYSFYKSPNARWRVYLRPRGRLLRGFHLHVVEAGSTHWHEHLRFRDHLRAHPEDARAYAGLKRELARRFGDDRGAYQAGKADLIRAILTRVVTPST